ncbi:MAG: DEAD/DEAH box helicase family protein [Victivallales bacterium]|nr:DEAD/DEAH box helicase family protein [Victivallales bacterium]MBQ6471833.1 DEAD/DEAH box helicase family protein [Victivallales bacterium]
MITPFHAIYFANELTRRGGEGLERLSQSLFDASVDLNPHQVEAALFAMHSPISKGVLLADEVGLGKTIEAGLVLCQFNAERKRHLLVICPASLRKQWQVELEDKFNLRATILDAKSYNQATRNGRPRPFSTNDIIITSYHFASKMAEDLRAIEWSLVVIDEAHKLRNSYRQSSKIGQRLRWALSERRKILLTATPLQNSLSELYGIATLIDEEMFPDLPSFRNMYANAGGDIEGLRKRLASFCRRTLRKDVAEYIRYTERRLLTMRFIPQEAEQRLYDAVSRFLQQQDCYAFPQGQRQLITLVVRKLLASSTNALRSTLEAIKARLIALRDENKDEDIPEDVLLDVDALDDYLDETELLDDEVEDEEPPEENHKVIDMKKLQKEIDELDHFIHMTYDVTVDTKTESLLTALQQGWTKMRELGAEEKTVIFTESRRSMYYLRTYLEQHGYKGQVVCYSGGGKKDPVAEMIYTEFMADNRYNSEVNTEGSKAIMMRHALVENFRTKAKIMISTEAGAEGINLQFCSLVINYDLPWNPQRIEQRIGRCHRYGQKHDVVVINFLNERNAADKRVYELLTSKFRLFNGVFGASDEVLGQLESGVGLERKILELYQQCRTEEEIQARFDQLQAELEAEINDKMRQTRRQVLENFDDSVRQILKIDYDEALDCLGEYGRKFWRLTEFMLKERADFNDEALTFTLRQPPEEDIPAGLYALKPKSDLRRNEDKGENKEYGHIYRTNCELGNWCLNAASQLHPPVCDVTFDISGYHGKISVLEQMKGKSGWMFLNKRIAEGIDTEDSLLFSGFTEDRQSIPTDVLEQFFSLDGAMGEPHSITPDVEARLQKEASLLSNATAQRELETSNKLFKERQAQLERWQDDQVKAAQHTVDTIRAELKAARRAIENAANLTEQTEATELAAQLEKKLSKARRNIDAVEDAAEAKRAQILSALKKKLVQTVTEQPLFVLHWTLK